MRFLKDGFGYEDLRALSANELPELAAEVRSLIVDTVNENGGHLGSSLGTVELTIALLRKFNPLEDKIIFDVGHQAYPYKILTDRSARFGTLRAMDGISGFPRREESPFDHFDTGHSSTSISAALGYAKARDLLGQKHHVAAVIGDASLINGLAFEALNHIKETRTRLIIILNDNKHSISPRVGGFATMLAKLSASTSYNKIKSAIKDCCRALPKGDALEKRLEGIRDQIKSLMKPQNIFDELDINYWGPFDGHNIEETEMIFDLARRYDRPVLLHFSTIKGKGLPEAERDPTKYHQVAPRAERSAVPKTPTWSDAASLMAEQLAEKDGRIVCLTAAMATGAKLGDFKTRFPERFFDVGIAESHMLTLAAGMAAGGLRPWVFIYSTFLQRAMDQLTHDVALQNLPVVIMADRAGLVGSDGPTHHGLLDVAWARAVPNLEIYAPADESSLRNIMSHAAARQGPTVIRYPRGAMPMTDVIKGRSSLGAAVVHDGEEWALLGHGVMVHVMLEARTLAGASGLPLPAVVDLRRLKPLDTDVIDGVLKRYRTVVVAEEDYLNGGVGELIAARIAETGTMTALKRLALPDIFIPHATIPEQREIYGLTARHILDCAAASQKIHIA